MLFSLLLWACTAKKEMQRNGLYLSADDFRQGKLSYGDTANSVRIRELLRSDRIDVCTYDSCFKILKRDVYGYRDKTGDVYRFYNNEKYGVMNPGEAILLYRQQIVIAGKGTRTEDKYFFSKTETTPVIPLSQENLYREFSGNKKFLENLEIHFRNGAELTEYNPRYKMYEINRLYQLAAEEVRR